MFTQYEKEKNTTANKATRVTSYVNKTLKLAKINKMDNLPQFCITPVNIFDKLNKLPSNINSRYIKNPLCGRRDDGLVNK